MEERKDRIENLSNILVALKNVDRKWDMIEKEDGNKKWDMDKE